MAVAPVSVASTPTAPLVKPHEPDASSSETSKKNKPQGVTENTSSLKHPDGPFTRFSAPINSITLPTRRQFFRQSLMRNLLPSYERGFIRYFKTLKDNPAFGIGVGALTLGLGGLFTAFRRHHRVIESAFLVAAIGYPVMALARHVPQMGRAYDTLETGHDRAKADEEFKTALDALVFKIGHVYLKPLGITAFLTYPLMNFRRVAIGGGKRLIAQSLERMAKAPPHPNTRNRADLLSRLDAQLTQLENAPWIVRQNQWANALAAWGDRIAARLSS
ncbi:MAG: hypothetical protein IPK79_07300 [Vampirovibrionales bacterium]|nr:hypothetical protein [Vampirovibrionales bacterium]